MQPKASMLSSRNASRSGAIDENESCGLVFAFFAESFALFVVRLKPGNNTTAKNAKG
jgi:hypothetical protein